MYHCKICIYMITRQEELLAACKGITPLPHFTHEYLQGAEADAALAARADVIFADIRQMHAEETAAFLLSHKKKETELILLADKEQTELLAAKEDADIREFPVTDIWVMPLSEAELRFRLLRWQNSYKMKMDFWETENFLDTTINCVPYMIWYKDIEGAHIKVNEMFCNAAGKTMEQIRGRNHFEVWDLDPNEYVRGEYICVDSEFEVLEKKETCVFDETVRIRGGMRELKTYKSPLFDLDGSVMGTVGVATDVTQERLYEQMIIKNANTDFLTGLYNRRYLYEYIEKARDGHMTVFCIDLDFFKSINDIYGHQEGDRALVLTAKTLQASITDGLISRMGGDEFLVAMFGARTLEEVETIRRTIKERLDTAFSMEDNFRKISASVGAAYSLTGEESFDSLVGEADAMMYREKQKNRQTDEMRGRYFEKEDRL